MVTDHFFGKTLVKKVLILTFTALLVFTAAHADKLYVGVDTAFVPFEFKGEDGKYTGFDVDLWAAIAKHLNLEYELKPMDFNGLIPALTTGNIDAALGAIFITSKREKAIDFSHQYFHAGLKVMVPSKTTDINSVEDLKGKKVAVKTGTFTVDYLNKIGIEKLVKFPNIDQAYLEVVTGGVDAAVHDAPNVLYFIKKAGKGRVKAVGPDVEAAYYGIAFPSGSELRDKVNVVLLEMKESGEYAELYREWFGTDPE